MGKGSPAPPTLADPKSVADTQQTYNTNAAAATQAANAVDQETPFGSLTYNQTGTGPGGIPLYTATTKLSQPQQQIVNQLQGDVSGQLGRADYGNTNSTDAIWNRTNGLVSDVLKANMNYVKPYYDQSHSQLDTQLRNQGFAPGQPGYDNAMRGLLDSQNRTTQQFVANFEPQAYNQAVSTYQLPLNMSAAEMGLINPAFAKSSMVPTPTTQVNPADYASAVQTQQDMLMKEYQAKQAQSAAATQGMFGIGSGVLGSWARNGFALPSFMGAGGAGAGVAGGAIDGAAMDGFGSAAAAAAALGPMAMV